MMLEPNLTRDRSDQNGTRLIRKLVQYLQNHEVGYHHKLDNMSGMVPDSLAYYDCMLDKYYLHSIDRPPIQFNNLEEHFGDIVKFFSYEDDELKIELLPGKTTIPQFVVINMTIPDTVYKDDERET
jgi:hypothetical protein